VQPILFQLPLPGGLTLDFPAYGTFMVLGMLLANLAGAPRAKTIGLRPAQVFDFGLLLVAGGVVGAHLLHVLVNLEDTFRDGLAAGLGRALAPWTGGLIYYGGLAGGIAVCLLYARWKRLQPLALLDFVAPLGALGLATTRIGCHLNGCCWGRPTDAFWGLVYPPGSPAQHSQLTLGLVAAESSALPVHPVQLYETAAALAIFVVLYRAYPRRRHGGQITAWFGILYACWRLVAETLRADAAGWLPGRPWWQPNLAQVLSLAVLAISLAALRWAARTAPAPTGGLRAAPAAAASRRPEPPPGPAP